MWVSSTTRIREVAIHISILNASVEPQRRFQYLLEALTNANDMAKVSLGSKTLWQYSHSSSILFAVLLFTAGFLCTLLWTNNLVQTESSASGPEISTLNQFSPAVSTFSITYQVVRSFTETRRGKQIS